jgi:hypothetical protein
MGKFHLHRYLMYDFHNINFHETPTWVKKFVNKIPKLMETQPTDQWPIMGNNEIERQIVSTLVVALLRTVRFINNYCYIHN